MARIFISYARADGAEIVQELKQGLEDLGYTVFLDVDDIPGGAEWEQNLREQVVRADALIAVVTPASKDSKYVYQEYEQAKAQNKVVLPLVVGQTPLPGYLQKWNAIAWDDANSGKTLLKIERSLREFIFQPHPRQGPFPVRPQPASRRATPFGTAHARHARSPSKLAPRRSAPRWWPIATGILALALVISLILLLTRNLTEPAAESCPFERLSTPFSPASSRAQILSPASCTTGWPDNTGLNIIGTYSPELEDKSLWVLVYVNGRYWPQAIDGCSKPEPRFIEKGNGAWNTRFSLGKAGEQYDVILLAVDPGSAADVRFMAWWKTSCDRDDYPGIPENEMPLGLYELDSITLRAR